MFILLVLAGVDLLLPAVKIPVYAWILIVFTWVLYKSVLETKPIRAKKKAETPLTEIYTPELDWIVSTEHKGVYSTTDGKWQLVKTGYQDKSDAYILFSDDEETAVRLTASKLAAAMDQADMVINLLTPAEEVKEC